MVASTSDKLTYPAEIGLARSLGIVSVSKIAGL